MAYVISGVAAGWSTRRNWNKFAVWFLRLLIEIARAYGF
jgi:hypothetical protein